MPLKGTSSPIPYRYCHCGCGQKTKIAKRGDGRSGIAKGEPFRFLNGHNARKPANAIRFMADGLIAIDIGHGYEAVIDQSDHNLVRGHRWHLCTGRITYAGNERGEMMHRVLMGMPKGRVVDHIDGDGLNNRRTNLRTCSHSENSQNQKLSARNTSGYKGVSWCKKTRTWRAAICIKGRHIRLGGFLDVLSAAQAYDRAALEYHGEFARLNFPVDKGGGS